MTMRPITKSYIVRSLIAFSAHASQQKSEVGWRTISCIYCVEVCLAVTALNHEMRVNGNIYLVNYSTTCTTH